MGAQPVRGLVPGHRPQPGPQALLRLQLPGVGPQGQKHVGGQLLHVLPGAPPGDHPHHHGAHIGGEAVDGPLQRQAAALPELFRQCNLVQPVPLLSKNRFYQYIRSGDGLVTKSGKKIPRGVLRRSIGTIYEPTHITQYLFLWREAVFRHSLPFLLMQPRFGLLLPRNSPYSEAVHPPDQCRGNRYAPPEVLCGSISPHAHRPPPV